MFVLHEQSLNQVHASVFKAFCISDHLKLETFKIPPQKQQIKSSTSALSRTSWATPRTSKVQNRNATLHSKKSETSMSIISLCTPIHCFCPIYGRQVLQLMQIQHPVQKSSFFLSTSAPEMRLTKRLNFRKRNWTKYMTIGMSFRRRLHKVRSECLQGSNISLPH